MSFTVSSCGGTNANNATVRWYQANVTGGTVAANVVQGTTFDPDGANTFFRFMPASRVDRVGDMAVGYTKSNATTNPQIKYAGRLVGDPVNTLGQTEQTLIDGTGAQSGNCGGSACTRWGDYSGMALDPNGCDFWDDGRVLRDHRAEPPDPDRLVPLPGLHDGRQRHALGHGHRRHQPDLRCDAHARQPDDDHERQRAATRSASPPGRIASLTASKPGFDPGSASTIAVPDGGTATRNFTLSAAAQSGCFTDNTQSTFQRGVPSNCDLVTNPGSVQLANPDNTEAKNATVSPPASASTTPPGLARRSRRP